MKIKGIFHLHFIYIFYFHILLLHLRFLALIAWLMAQAYFVTV